MIYKTRSFPVEVYCWLGPNPDGSQPVAPDWVRERAFAHDPQIRYMDGSDSTLLVDCPTGTKECRRGDWIIRMPGGALDVCSQAVFDLFYEPC